MPTTELGGVAWTLVPRPENGPASAAVVAAGYGAGIGLIGMIAIAIALISKAISQIVY